MEVCPSSSRLLCSLLGMHLLAQLLTQLLAQLRMYTIQSFRSAGSHQWKAGQAAAAQ